MKEVRKAIPGYRGKYEVSNRGRLKSLPRFRKTKSGGVCPVPLRYMTGTPNGSGYLNVTLSKNGTQKVFHIHQLVMLAFVGPCPVGMEVCHDPNRDRTDNRLKNLRYGTPKDNGQDSVKHGTRLCGEAHHGTRLTWEQVRLIRRCYSTGVFSQPELARAFDTNQATVWAIVNHKTWKEHKIMEMP